MHVLRDPFALFGRPSQILVSIMNIWSGELSLPSDELSLRDACSESSPLKGV